jgi:hypothetical protein
MNNEYLINLLFINGLDNYLIIGIVRDRSRYNNLNKKFDDFTSIMKRRSRVSVSKVTGAGKRSSTLDKLIKKYKSLNPDVVPDIDVEVNEGWMVKWRSYKKEAWRLTNLVDVSVLENSELRGFKGHHLDHKISIWFGFKNSVPVEDIASIKNLRFIPHKDNMKKGVGSVFS